MAYQSLYRRYRPRRFSEVRGQEPVVRALRNAVREERVGHAYLFSGPRGTGKTSTARILAKALNCENLQDGEPDGTCESCLAIDAGTSYDVQELDAASNRGVDDVKDLISRVSLGSPGRTKVYILDEVHMLTPAASAALLKTLEEPPEHVVFVLATTDPHKVLPTIRSRTQHYEFRLLGADQLAEHVAWVIHDAGLDLPDDVIDHVVRTGGGSARDTLSSLEQVAATGGVAHDGDALDDLLDAVAASDTGRALGAVADALAAGRDPRILGETLLGRLRDVFLLRMGASTAHLPPGDLERVRAWADQLGDRATTRALELVGDALLEMRQAPEPRVPLDVALVKLTRPGADASVAALEARVAALEAALASGGAPVPPAASSTGPGGSPPAAAPAPAPEPASPAAPADTSPADAGGTAERPAPPPRPGGRPADVARAELAAQRNRSAPPKRPSPSGKSTAPAPASAPAPPPAVAPDPSPAPAPSVATAPPTAAAEPEAGAPAEPPSPAAAAAPAPAGGVPDLAQLEGLWAETVLPSLGGLTKAMYVLGRFTGVEGAQATFALPNDVHRQNCERKRPEVEAALSAAAAAPIVLRLVADEGGASDEGAAGERSGGAADGPATGGDDFDLDGTDVHDLPDAPDAATGGLDALTDAFPGSTFVQDS